MIVPDPIRPVVNVTIAQFNKDTPVSLLANRQAVTISSVGIIGWAIVRGGSKAYHVVIAR